MQDLRETKRYFETKLIPTLSKLEKKLELQKKIGLILIITILLSVLSIFLEFIAIGVFFMLITAVVFLMNNSKSKSTKEEYKDTLVAPLMKSIDPTLRYTANGVFSQREFKNSLLFENSEFYESEHFINCQLNKETVDMAFINAYDEIEAIDEDDSDTIETIFAGLFAVTKSTRKIKGKVCIFPDFAQKHLGFIGQGMQDSSYKGLKKVKLDDPRFEKEFLIYATDQVTANYVLNHTVMQALTSLVKKNKQKIYLSFIDDKVYLGMNLPFGFFQPIIKDKLSNFSSVRESLQAFYLTVSIFEALQKHHEL